MMDRDTWQEIFSTIKKNKLRTFLTALGIYWGIFMLVFLLGMGNGLETGVFRSFGSGARNIMFVWSNKTTVPYNGMSPGRRINLTLDDVLQVESQISGIKGVSPRVYLGDRNVDYRLLSGSYGLRGETPDGQWIEGFILDEGRYLNVNDINDTRKSIVIGRTVKKELFGEESAVGKHVGVSGIDFQVVGVFATPNVRERDQEDMESAIIPITTAYKAFGIQSRRINQFIVAAQQGVRVSDLEPRVRKLLKERHDIAPEDKSAIRGFNLEKEFQGVQNLFIGIKGLLWFIGVGTLIAGIVGVSNIMLITVKERTKEIGIRKALGATPGSIVSMILTESIFITSLAGYLGLLAGTFIIIGINVMMTSMGMENDNFYDPKVNLTIAISALVFLILAGAVAGMIPAIQASRVNPVIALKDE